MRKAKWIVVGLLAIAGTGCSEGERCEIATYQAGCDGERAWTYCADKSSTGMKKLQATVVRIECEANTVCVESGEHSSCVAAPAETCEVLDETRCVDGLTQKCRDIDAVSLASGVRYWTWVGLGC